MAVSKRLRYEVLRRDGHKCRYCGHTASDTELAVDHVIPKSLGGPDHPSNLVTSCVDCNLGKATTIPDLVSLPDVDEGELNRLRKSVSKLPSGGEADVFPYIWFVESFIDSLVAALSGKPEAHRLAYDAMWASFPEAHCLYVKTLAEIGDFDEAEEAALNELTERSAWFMRRLEATRQSMVGV